MRIPLHFVFLLFVLAEIAGFIVVGKAIGILPTLGLLLAAMVLGLLLLRQQSVATLLSVRAELAAGGTPARPIAEGAVLAAASLLIMLPGFLTDIAGILLFIPPRAALAVADGRRAQRASAGGAQPGTGSRRSRSRRLRIAAGIASELEKSLAGSRRSRGVDCSPPAC